MSVLFKAWEEYRRIYPANMSLVQEREIRQTFFAGALSVVNILAALEDDEAGVATLQKVCVELRVEMSRLIAIRDARN